MTVGDHFGLLESLIGIADDFFSGGFDAWAGLGQIVLAHQVGQDFVFHLNVAGGFLGDFFGYGGDGNDLGALPLHFGSRGRDDLDGLDAGHPFGGGGIDLGDAGVGVGAGLVGREEQVLAGEVGRILGASGGFLGAVQALDGLAHHLAGFHGRPTVIGGVSHCSSLLS